MTLSHVITRVRHALTGNAPISPITGKPVVHYSARSIIRAVSRRRQLDRWAKGWATRRAGK